MPKKGGSTTRLNRGGGDYAVAPLINLAESVFTTGMVTHWAISKLKNYSKYTF